MIRFLLNDSTVGTAEAAGSTVLDFVRYRKRLTGTKIGCREGDCGACTVLVGDFENGRLTYRSATSCLMPLGNAAGKHIVTVEGLNGPELSPVQQAMVDTNGTQCGFCTLGFVLSFTGFVLHPSAKTYPEAIAAIDGNICRCTGYKSIERAAQVICDKIEAKPAEGTLEWLVAEGFLPGYFTGIEARLRDLEQNAEPAPATNGIPALPLAGGTDLLVQKPHAVKASPVSLLADREGLRSIRLEEGRIRIGAAATVTQLLESRLLQEHFPQLAAHGKLISSTPIRNMATVGGNLVNASPIGDLTIFLLALDAQLVLNDMGSMRTVALKEFYKGYKQLDKAPGELIEAIFFAPPASRFSFEKVSKRTNLDIASVNSAAQIGLDASGQVTFAHLSAGGVGPFPKYLSRTGAYLQGKALNTEAIEGALALAQEEIAPISDARGTADYKRLLLRQLLLAHFARIDAAPVHQMLSV
ncbi:FAD binding domain-containing protein [Flaviaesturariibacter amylovorans]|uniref:Xanthine dehydrogenase small subunit n=1 Tax=Flaviaesturariibacter amylovorans TaxID=1084520 RepID=A0ABP8GZ96_9BACT